MKRDCGGKRNCRGGDKYQNTSAMKGEKRNVEGRALSGEGGRQYGGRVIEEG